MALLFVKSMAQNNSRILKTAIKALELLLLSAGLVSTLVMVKRAVASYSCDIVFSSVMGFCNSIKCFFSSSLYIWIIMHLIFMLIAASSSIFRRRENDSQDDELEVSLYHELDMQIAESSVVVSFSHELDMQIAESSVVVSFNHELDMQITESSVVSAPPPPPPPPNVTEVNEQESEEEDTLEATWKAIIGGEKEKPKKKHLKKSEMWDIPLRHTQIAESSVVVSFNHELDMQIAELSVVSPQPPLPAPPPPLDVTEVNEQESEEEDTLEATWKAIIGGEKEKPKKKHLKKSETWDVPPRCTAAGVRRLDSEEVLPSTPKWKELRKSETFNDAVSMTRRGGLRRDPSTNNEEFNQKIEAFIKKFNDNIRLQRQESHQRFLDMIGRGL